MIAQIKPQKAKGLTLLEMIISIGIFILVATAISVCFDRSLVAYRASTDKNEAAQETAIASEWLVRDIQSAPTILVAEQSNIVLVNSDQRDIRYYLDEDQTIQRQDSADPEYLLAEGVIQFSFKYYDINNNNIAAPVPANDIPSIRTVEIDMTTQKNDQEFQLNTVARFEYNLLPPVAHWKFDEGSGSTALDSSGMGNTGTLYGPTWTIGKFGYALSFDGASYVRVLDSSSLDITGDITVEAWVQFADLDNKQAIVGKKEGWASYSLRINQDVADQRLCFFVEGGDSTKRYKVFSTTQVVSGTWYHVAGVREGTDLKIYIDGNLENTASAPEMAANDYDLFIGADPRGSVPGSANYIFSGIIDEVRIHRRALRAYEFYGL